MQLARRKREWPRLPLPAERGAITVHDVLAATEGPERDAMIDRWCESVWAAWASQRKAVVALAAEVNPGLKAAR
jgi:hypothetical protein